jgi:hypothetical protein
MPMPPLKAKAARLPRPRPTPTRPTTRALAGEDVIVAIAVIAGEILLRSGAPPRVGL